MGSKEGRQIFVDALRRFAQQNRNPRLTPIIRRIEAPVRVAVRGREGVGRATVAAALTAAGVTVTSEVDADVHAIVIAETLKPEDRAMLGSVHGPAVTILNKADLTGFGDGGPLAAACRRAAACRDLTGIPTVAMVGLLATAELDAELVGALQVLVDSPADLTSTDSFVQCGHRLPRELRSRLMDTLDRFGIAHAVLATADAADAASATSLLRRLSRIDRVVEYLDAAGAEVRYRRLRAAVNELRTLAVQSGDERLAEFISTDDTVLAVMAAAVDVVEAAGMRVDHGDDHDAHLRRAVHWRRYGRGPVDALHRTCSSDITRGSLRLLGRSR